MRHYCAVLLVPFSLSGFAFAQPTLAKPKPVKPAKTPLARLNAGLGKQILRRMTKAELTVSFLGREVTVGQDGRNTEQWVKRDPKRGIRRESIKPEGILLVDNQKRQFLVNQKEKLYREGKSQLAEFQKRYLEALRAGEGALIIEFQGQDSIAGRMAEVVLVHPAPGRAGPSRRFWVDRETGLRLRTEERAQEGRILSNTYYLSLELNPVLRDEDFAPPPIPTGFPRTVDTQKRYATLEEAAKDGVIVKPPGWLPAGFRLRRITANQGPHSPIHVQWGNDLTAISLALVHGAMPPMILRMLAGNEAGFVQLNNGERAYAWKSSEGYYMLLGNLPDDQLKRIADSVK